MKTITKQWMLMLVFLLFYNLGAFVNRFFGLVAIGITAFIVGRYVK